MEIVKIPKKSKVALPGAGRDRTLFRIAKGFNQPIKYGHAVGRIKAKEAKLLNWQRLERLLEASYEEAMRIIAETDYGRYLEGAEVSADIDRGLMMSLRGEYEFLDEILRGSNVARYLHYKYDFHNLKVILKRELLGESPEDLLSEIGSIDPELLAKAIEDKDFHLIPEQLAEIAGGSLEEIEAAGADPQIIDSVLERRYLEVQLRLAREEKSKFLIDYTRAKIDLANVRVLLRAQQLDKGGDFLEVALADGGTIKKRELLELSAESLERIRSRLQNTKYGRVLGEALESGDKTVKLTSLDRASDDYLRDNLHKFGQVMIGVEPVMKYMSTRENEVVWLRIIFMGKLHGVPPEKIEERLGSFE